MAAINFSSLFAGNKTSGASVTVPGPGLLTAVIYQSSTAARTVTWNGQAFTQFATAITTGRHLYAYYLQVAAGATATFVGTSGDIDVKVHLNYFTIAPLPFISNLVQVAGVSGAITPIIGDTLIAHGGANLGLGEGVGTPAGWTSHQYNSATGSGGDWTQSLRTVYKRDTGTGGQTANFTNASCIIIYELMLGGKSFDIVPAMIG